MSNSSSVQQQPAPIFQGDPAVFQHLDLDSPIAGFEDQLYDYARSGYRRAAAAADAASDSARGDAYRFLQVLTGFETPQDGYQHPYFRPAQLEFLPKPVAVTDLGAKDIEAVRIIAARTQNAMLRARTNDILWTFNRAEVAACRGAASAYLDLAEQAGAQWVSGIWYMGRGAYLTRQLGPNSSEYTAVVTRIVAIVAFAEVEPGIRLARIMELLLKMRAVDATVYAIKAAVKAASELALGHHDTAHVFRMLEAEWWAMAKNSTAAQAAIHLAAECKALMAEDIANGGPGRPASFMAASDPLKEAIHLLRRATGKPDRVRELRARLAEYQRKSMDELKGIALPQQIVDQMQTAHDRASAQAESIMKGLPLERAIEQLAFITDTVDVQQLLEKTKGDARQTPMLSLIGARNLDSDGRTIGVTPGMGTLDQELLDKALEDRCFRDLARFTWPGRVAGIIEPARTQLLSDHNPTLEQLQFMVTDNDLIPSGHEQLFLRGIHAGLHNDYTVASHILIPQLENLLRRVLEIEGVEVTSLWEDGTEELKMLGPILSHPKIGQLFGSSLQFELRGVLLEKAGYNFRGRIAHGFVSQPEAEHVAARLSWWLVLRLVMTCYLECQKDEAPAAPAAPLDRSAQKN